MRVVVAHRPLRPCNADLRRWPNTHKRAALRQGKTNPPRKIRELRMDAANVQLANDLRECGTIIVGRALVYG
jgi:hypothetical protein